MFTLQIFTSILVVFLSFSVQAFPLFLRDVFTPKILQPVAGSVWPIGSRQTVTWDVAYGVPSQITNPIGQIILGTQDQNGNLNLDFEHPVIGDFKLKDGNVTFTVPNVPPGDNYVICLFGDSGNISPVFTITLASSSVSGTSSSSASSPPSTDITSTTIGHTSPSSVSISVSNSASASSASPTSAGWSLYHGNSILNSPVFFLMCVAPFVMV